MNVTDMLNAAASDERNHQHRRDLPHQHHRQNDEPESEPLTDYHDTLNSSSYQRQQATEGQTQSPSSRRPEDNLVACLCVVLILVVILLGTSELWIGLLVEFEAAGRALVPLVLILFLLCCVLCCTRPEEPPHRQKRQSTRRRQQNQSTNTDATASIPGVIVYSSQEGIQNDESIPFAEAQLINPAM